MTADHLSRLSTGVTEMLAGTPLEHDLDKLEQLGRVILEEQAAVVRRHLIFEIPWEAAFEGVTLRLPEPVEGAKAAEVADEPPPASMVTGMEQSAPAAAEPAEHSEPVPGVTKQIESWPIEKLNPNKFNAKLFPDSLSESSIAEIAVDLAKNGQRVAVEVTTDGTIVDGERRWRGARHVGWRKIDVIAGPELTDDEMLDRVIDACTSARQMTLREQVHVYVAVIEQLQREAGRQQGRPSGKTFQKGNVFLTPRDVRSTAAMRAGFSSPSLALRAEAIFTRGSTELQANVLDGALAITAAYDALPKRTKKKKEAATPTPTPSDANVAAVGGDQGERKDELSESSPPPEITPPDLPPSATHPVNVRRGDGESSTDDPAREGATPLTSEAEKETEPTPESGEDELADPPIAIIDDEDEEPEQHVTHHVDAICAHITRLSEHDYDEAAMWLDDAAEQMRAALGDRPDSDEVEHEDDQFDEFDELLDS